MSVEPVASSVGGEEQEVGSVFGLCGKAASNCFAVGGCGVVRFYPVMNGNIARLLTRNVVGVGINETGKWCEHISI